MNRIYAAIDLKSFYASVECRERNLDPLTTNLVVADRSRTEKTICLAVSPSLKKYGIPGRARLFEVIQKVNNINKERRSKIRNRTFVGKSCNENELKNFLEYANEVKKYYGNKIIGVEIWNEPNVKWFSNQAMNWYSLMVQKVNCLE